MPGLTTRLLMTTLVAYASLAAAACAGRSFSQPASHDGRTNGSPPTAPAENRDEPPKLFPVSKNGKTGFIDHTGKLIIPLKFPLLYIWSEFSDGMARTALSTTERPGYCCKYGYIDTTGRMVVEPQYWEAKDFAEGLAAVKMGDRWGYIDREGRTALAPQWLAADNFSEGLAGVCTQSGGCGYIDHAGKMIITLQGASAPGEFHDGLASVLIDSNGFKFGYIDKTGRLTIAGPFDKAWDFSGGLALVLVGGKTKFIDKTGRVVLEPENMSAAPFSDGLARVSVNGRIGYMDKMGQVIIAPQYEEADDFSEGLAAVKIKGRWGYIDKSGRVVIKPQFDNAGKFVEGIAAVSVGWVYADVPQTKAKGGYIDRTGKYVWPPSR